MKLPFLNRKNYIVLKAYTYASCFLDHVPITLANREDPVEKNGTERSSSTFVACFGRIMGLSRSATVYMPSNIEFAANSEGTVSHTQADTRSPSFGVSYEHAEDPHYVTTDTVLSKMELPWKLEETSGTTFVLAKHILNKTMMNIPTGVINFDNQHSINVFNLIPKLDFNYEVKFKTPIVSLYPMSEKKLVVESYCDPDKFHDLCARNAYRPYWSANAVKMSKSKGCPV